MKRMWVIMLAVTFFVSSIPAQLSSAEGKAGLDFRPGDRNQGTNEIYPEDVLVQNGGR
jgi:hypothetical protein